MTEIIVALITAGGALLGVWLTARKTRRLNTEEHSITAGALHDIHEDVRQTNQMLVTHIADREAHGVHVTTVVTPPPPPAS